MIRLFYEQLHGVCEKKKRIYLIPHEEKKNKNDVRKTKERIRFYFQFFLVDNP